jgi:hypothetical protein
VPLDSVFLEKVGTALGNSLTGIDVLEHHRHVSGKAFIVGFEGDHDPLKPRNWSLVKRILFTANVGIIALVVGTAASIDSAAIPQAAAEFGVSEVVEALATGLVSILRFDLSTSIPTQKCLVLVRVWTRRPHCRTDFRNSGQKSCIPRFPNPLYAFCNVLACVRNLLPFARSVQLL